jgi:hypothetical protein
MIKNPSIEVEQIPFFLSSEKKEKEKKNKKEKKTSICLFDESCKNHLLISQKIQKIENYQDYYRILEKAEKVGLGEKTLSSHILLTYLTKDSDVSFSTFFLHENKNPKEILFYLQDSYQYLLKSIKILHDHSICYFGLSSQTIIFESTIPRLNNFESSFFITNDNQINKTMHQIRNLQNFSFQPLEVHVLYYFLNLCTNKGNRYQALEKCEGLKLTTLSSTQIEEISSHYVKSIPIFSLFSESYREKYKEKCLETLKKYINQNQTFIVEELTKFCNTWDNYALTILYLHLVGKAIQQFSLENTFFNGWMKILKKYLDPDPEQRESLEFIMKKWDSLYEEYPNWKFVKSIY